MNAIIAQVLPSRKEAYLQGFREKLLAEGITEPSDLLRASQDAMETKLATHGEFNVIEVSDAISLRCFMVMKARSDAELVVVPKGRPYAKPSFDMGRKARNEAKQVVLPKGKPYAKSWQKVRTKF